MKRFLQVMIIGGLLFAFAPPASTQTPNPPPPTEIDGLEYQRRFFSGANYDPSVPTPESIFGFPVGRKVASPRQIEQCLRSWEVHSRTRLFEYARTFEGRPLYIMIVSSSANLNRLDEIQAGYGRLADPRNLSAQDGDRLVESLPAVAWFAYSIHGNESSGADAAIAILYHLIASTDRRVSDLLDEVVIIVDPMMNPDGRARFVQQLDEHRAASPNVDDQSLLHAGYWPWGRGNHYLFDLNRDWILGVHPESRGRIRAAGEWHPLLFIDAHEMGAQSTYLFSPPRDPVNPHYPVNHQDWLEAFARDHAAAFDRNFWPYYTGEWNEGWYPGYSNAWVGFRGAVGILYEQARIAEDAVRRPEGTLLTYSESVHHQVASTMANLQTLQNHSRAILRDFLEDRRLVSGTDSPFANRTFAVLPTNNASRMRNFLDLMQLQGFEVYSARENFTVSNAVDQLGRTIRRQRLPAGTVLIPNRQPEARLIATMLEFDPRIPDRTLQIERREILRKGKSRIYDVTAWNLTMMHGLEALTLPIDLPDAAVPFEPEEPTGRTTADPNPLAIAYVIDGADDLSVAAAGRLMERGVQVRVTNRPVLFVPNAFARGSVVVTRNDNPGADDNLHAEVERTATELGLKAEEVTFGFGEGDLPDIGGEHFLRLEPPRIALLSRGGISSYDYGSIWHTLDQRLGLRHSHLDVSTLERTDLRRYNVIVVPDRRAGEIDGDALGRLRDWIEEGGTLIAVGRSAASLARDGAEISAVRQLNDVLDRLELYEIDLLREILGASSEIAPAEEIWSHSPPDGLRFPWEEAAESDMTESRRIAQVEQLRKRDTWQGLFMPQGTLVAGRIDPEHWLTFGSDDRVPILFGNHPVLMSAIPVEAPVRLGILSRQLGESAGGPIRVGWAVLPSGYRLHLRMSGLLWPEAADRVSNAAWVTREAVGKGQVILFASPPVFRGSTLGTARILTNAMVYGPGLGASHPIRP